jgi:hypothetical protein
MAADRGAANLAKFNEDRSENILPLLTHELQMCRKRRLEFDSVGLLAAYLSDRIKTHRTTLTRNPRYKALLLGYLAGQPGVVAATPDSTEDPAVLQAKLAVCRLEAAGLREQVDELTARIDRLTRASTSESVTNERIDLANLSMLFATVLTRFPDFLSVDFNKRELHDLSARPSDRVVAGSERFGAFCRWVEQNQALPLLKQLKLRPSR